MKTTLIALLVAGTIGLATVGIATVGLVTEGYEERHEAYEREHYGEWEDDEDDEHPEHGGEYLLGYLVDPGYGQYEAECGSCHFAYPPPMLPVESWRGMMASLADHFGDNAELDEATAAQITSFLTRNAAGSAPGAYSERSWRATRDQAPPLRITLTDYFLGQHHEIPDRMVTDNPQVASFSRCETCHQGAGRGDFEEDGVRIPGYGPWDH